MGHAKGPNPTHRLGRVRVSSGAVTAPLVWLTGPPGAGKTTVATALLGRYPFGIHVPVDDLRLWVVSGLSESVPWTEETERQFQVAEDAALDVACRYQAAGFAVVVDHCRNLERADALFAARGLNATKVCLLPRLEVALHRNATRGSKPFDSAVLEDTIRFTHARFAASAAPGWLRLDNSDEDAEATTDRILASLDPQLRP